ncbi:MAG: FAD-dependent oxidoreductase [Rhodospirillales bacterium]|nr:FAD-dependent oxidoreductase [Rhodospirillales bacterium]
MTSIAIVGSGLAALAAARHLADVADVTLFEKSRGIGGRMATRRAEPYSFDHGAQFFTAKTPAFQDFLAPLEAAGIIQHWCARFAEIDNGKIISQRVWDDQLPHFVGTPAMNVVGKYIGVGLNIVLDTRIVKIEHTDRWRLWDDRGVNIGDFDWVISTVPAGQSLDILPSSVSFYPDIETVKMKACFSLMLGFEKALPLAFDAAHVAGADISWISVNSSKPGRTDDFSLLVHSTNLWADAHLQDARESVLAYLCRQTSETIGHDVSDAAHQSVHGWHFANLEKQIGATHHLDADAQIAACGDWCIQGRVEAAFTSGRALASEILRALGSSGIAPTDTLPPGENHA